MGGFFLGFLTILLGLGFGGLLFTGSKGSGSSTNSLITAPSGTLTGLALVFLGAFALVFLTVTTTGGGSCPPTTL